MAKKPTIKNAGLKFKYALTPINKSRITRIVQHHMAHPSWDINDVHNSHKNGRGWNGIGYNYWISFDGTIYEGRGLNVGAHASGYNSTSIGIGYQGDFTKQKMTDAQLKAGRALNEWLLSEFGLSKDAIVGHNEVAATACPGKNFRMSELKGGTVKTPKPQSVAKKQNKANLTVDGKWGNSTTKELQKALGTPIDGYLSNQLRNSVTNALYGTTAKFNNTRKGSLVIKALQRKVGVNADGLLGPATIRSLQKYLGTVVDGKLSRPSLVVKELQRRLNAGTF